MKSVSALRHPLFDIEFGMPFHHLKSLIPNSFKLVAACIIACGMCDGLCEESGNSIQATRISQPPVIDGRLDDDCWKIGKPITGFYIMNSTQMASLKTEGYTLYDDNNFYVGVRCYDSDLKN